jgi:Cys-rich protein (TIGR01571 family)
MNTPLRLSTFAPRAQDASKTIISILNGNFVPYIGKNEKKPGALATPILPNSIETKLWLISPFENMTLNDGATKGRYERIDYNGANPFDPADDEVLDQSLLLTPETSIPAATGQALLSVVAPATLPEGYTMDVQVGGRGQLYTVKVPPGGVEEGQSFEVNIEGRATSSNNLALGTVEDLNRAVAVPRVSVPVGAWRDGLCDCCRFGCCHPVFWNAFCCCAFLTAQVMTRMNLDILGRPAPTSRKVNTSYVVLIIVLLEVFLFRIVNVQVIVFSMTHNTLTLPSGEVTTVPKEGMEGLASLFDTFFLFQRLMYLIFILYIFTVTRAFVRNKYAIPTYVCTSGFGIVEDCCLSFWCPCCTAGQLARHTMDYDTYPGVCCSRTGAPDYVPSII